MSLILVWIYFGYVERWPAFFFLFSLLFVVTRIQVRIYIPTSGIPHDGKADLIMLFSPSDFLILVLRVWGQFYHSFPILVGILLTWRPLLPPHYIHQFSIRTPAPAIT